MPKKMTVAQLQAQTPEENGHTPQAPIWRNRIVGSGMARVDQLVGNPNNARIHPKRQQDAMLDILREIGTVQDVIVNKRTGFVVDGHMRVELAITEGVEEIPVKWVELDEDEELVVLYTFDPIAQWAGYAREALQETTPLARQRAIPGSALDSFLEEMARKNPVKVEPFPIVPIPEGILEDVEYPDDGEDPQQVNEAVEGDVAPRGSDTVVLVFDREGHDDFMMKVSSLMSAWGDATVTDTIVDAVETAYRGLEAQEIR